MVCEQQQGCTGLRLEAHAFVEAAGVRALIKNSLQGAGSSRPHLQLDAPGWPTEEACGAELAQAHDGLEAGEDGRHRQLSMAASLCLHSAF